ncbi:YfhO family protein [Loigolactobacillus coryniformis]|uniref:YfhO family protein n=1 Tax=Loigolactobacillus coryniformis TaxID=1610 RepID=UPI003993F58C
MLKFKSKRSLLLMLGAFLIPALLFTLVLISKHIYPFGDFSLLKDDMNYQYINYFAYYKRHFGDLSSFLYSYNMTLGGNFLGLTSYYLLSPFNLILLLFPVRHFPLAIYIMTTLKLSFAGLNMYLFLHFRQMHVLPKITQPMQNTSLLLFSTAYALMSYSMVYSLDIMWLDVVMLLPLVILGIEWQFKGQSSVLYLGTLFLSLIFNYYIGFMVCLFAASYFVFRFIQLKFIQRQPLKSATLWLRFALSSLLAGGTAAFILLPTFTALRGVKGTVPYKFTFKATYNALDFIMKLLGGSFRYTDLWLGPNIFAGMLVLCLTIFYFLDHQFKIQERLLVATFLLYLFLCSYISGLNLIWHGLSAPQGYPNRWAFVFSFMFILLAQQEFSLAKKPKIEASLKLFGVIFFLCALFAKLYPTIFNAKIVVYNIIFSALILFAYGLVKNVNKPATIWLLLLVSSLDLAFNARAIFAANYPAITQTAFSQYLQQTQPVIDKIKQQDKHFYRIGTTFQRTENDPLLLNYNGVSHYSSSEKVQTIKFTDFLGYLRASRWTNYNNGSTLTADSLLGIKYQVTTNNSAHDQIILANGGLAHTSKQEPLTATVPVFTSNHYIVYRNPLALNLGTVVNNQVLTYNFKQQQTQNIFKRQNELLSKMTGKSANVLTAAKLLTKAPVSGQINYQYQIKQTGATYLYMPMKTEIGLQPIDITINGKKMTNSYSDAENGIINLGQHTAGEQLRITVAAQDPHTLSMTEQPQIATEDHSQLKTAILALKKQPVSLKKQSNTKLTSTIVADHNKQMLLLTLPYDKGWQAKINGRPVTTRRVAGNLLAIPLKQGKQTYELTFTPEGLRTGLIISVISILLAVSYLIFELKIFLKKRPTSSH